MADNSLRNMTRGGQTFLHNLRMINQVLNRILLWTVPIGLMVSFAWFMLTTDSYSRYIGQQWGWARFYLFFDGSHHQQIFQLQNGSQIKISSTQIIYAPFVQTALDELSDKVRHSFYAGCITYLITIMSVIIWLVKRGDKQSQPKHIKGDYLGDVNEAKKIMRHKGEVSSLVIGCNKLPLPVFSEVQHYLFHGTTGSGKSGGIRELLYQIRRRGERALIYDKSCNFVEEFYLPSYDTMMNPFDARGVDWSLWKECRDKAEFENLAAAQIPMPLSTQDPFWVNAARTIFAAAAYRLRKEKNPKVLPLLRYLLTADIQELQSLLKGTEAETLMSEKTEKTAISIKSVLATYLKSLCYIKGGDNPFSIREWMQNDNNKGWLFFSSLDSKHESAKPLITAWLDIAINELLSLRKNETRRIWFILDELTSLNQLPYLNPGLAEARKFGGCFIIGLLSSAELAWVYGDKRAQAISSLLNTRFMFRQPDPDVAMWSSKNLGETTIEEVREGISYGANTMRDGVSISRVERDKSVVSYSEIMRLNNLTCFARLPGKYPIIEINFDYKKPAKNNEPFIPRPIEQNDLRSEVLELTKDLEKNLPKDARQTAPINSMDVQNNASIISKQIKVEERNYRARSFKERILE